MTPIGYYQQGGGSGIASVNPNLSVGVADNYAATLFGADLAFHMDFQNLSGFTDGQAITSFSSETGETATADNVGNEPLFNFNGIGSHYALQIDNASVNTITATPAVSMVGVNEYTAATVARIDVPVLTGQGIVEYTRFVSNADNERIVHEQSGLFGFSSRWLFDNGSSIQPVNFVTYPTTVLIVSRRLSGGQLDCSVYDINSIDSGTVAPIIESVANAMVFAAQPTVTFGDKLFGSTGTVYVGEHWFANRRLTDAELIPMATHYRAKWS